MRFLNKTTLAAVCGALVFASCSNEQKPRVMLVHNEADQMINVSVDGGLFTAYRYNDTLRKPILFPVNSAGGIPVTRGYPINARPNERVDHPHQAGVWFNFGDVNGVDFWNNSYARPEEDLHRYGSIRQRGMEIIQNSADTAELAITLEWRKQDGAVLLVEETRYYFSAAADERMIERRTKLTAVADTVIFRDNKEGLFAIRTARAFESPASDSLLLTGPDGFPMAEKTISNSGVNGRYMSSAGLEGAAVWGASAKWAALSAAAGGDSITIAIFDHPDNPGFPAHWHARDYGLFSVNNLGRKSYDPELEALEFALQKGESLTFRHRLAVKSNGYWSSEDLDREFDKFANKKTPSEPGS